MRYGGRKGRPSVTPFAVSDGNDSKGRPITDARGDRNSQSEDGATAAEYAILASLIAAVIVVAVGALGSAVLRLFRLVLENWPGG